MYLHKEKYFTVYFHIVHIPLKSMILIPLRAKSRRSSVKFVALLKLAGYRPGTEHGVCLHLCSERLNKHLALSHTRLQNRTINFVTYDIKNKIYIRLWLYFNGFFKPFSCGNVRRLRLKTEIVIIIMLSAC